MGWSESTAATWARTAEVMLFGATADLTPLAVAAVGLMCGSITGALFGFFVGLFFDAALVQTMGLTSFVCVVAGYGAGRLRELRDPQATVTRPGDLRVLSSATDTIDSLSGSLARSPQDGVGAAGSFSSVVLGQDVGDAETPARAQHPERLGVLSGQGKHFRVMSSP